MEITTRYLLEIYLYLYNGKTVFQICKRLKSYLGFCLTFIDSVNPGQSGLQ